MFVDVAKDQDIKIGGIQKTLVTGDIHHHTNANLYILADEEGHIKAGTNGGLQMNGSSGQLVQHQSSAGFRTRTGLSSTNPTYQHKS